MVSELRSTRLFTKLIQRYWRVSRGLTLGAQGVVIDAQDRILLIKHTYRPGWHFPGGGVERRETALAALARELEEEAGIELLGKPELFGLYANFRYFPSDHVALYVVRDWTQPMAPQPTSEIAAHQFFARAELPHDVSPAAARRISELYDGVARDVMW